MTQKVSLREETDIYKGKRIKHSHTPLPFAK